MLIRMSKWQLRPELGDMNLRARWYEDEGLRRVWYGQNGLVQAHVLGRQDSLERMTFSVWESEEHYHNFASSDALAIVTEAAEDLYAPAGRPVAQVWNVITDDWLGKTGF
jgi:heme-degrading monooxygenase HmoA